MLRGVRETLRMPDEFEAQLEQARRARDAKEAQARNAAEHLREQTRQAKQEAQAMLPELLHAARTLQAARLASEATLKYKSSGGVTLWKTKGLFGERVVGWNASGVIVPFRGEPTTHSMTERAQVPVTRFAAMGLEQYSTYDGTNGHQTHTNSATERFHAAVTAITKHLVEIEQ